jgi:uncharacterized protein (TIGR02453 family)
MLGFGGFPPETKAFLEGITANNHKEWFTANRKLYDLGYVDTGRAFVEAMGPALQKISPTVQYEPKIGASLMRVNRDTRFSKDKRPYKDHLDLFFWHGQQKGWTHPGFFLRMTEKDVWLGSGMHHFEGDLLARYRDAVVDGRAGKALAAAIAKVAAAGDYAVGGMPRKQVPRGYDKTHPRAQYLLWESLPAMARMTLEDALAPDFGEKALTHFRSTWPIGKWLLDEVAER